jgi:hypothetical protein
MPGTGAACFNALFTEKAMAAPVSGRSGYNCLHLLIHAASPVQPVDSGGLAGCWRDKVSLRNFGEFIAYASRGAKYT